VRNDAGDVTGRYIPGGGRIPCGGVRQRRSRGFVFQFLRAGYNGVLLAGIKMPILATDLGKRLVEKWSVIASGKSLRGGSVKRIFNRAARHRFISDAAPPWGNSRRP